MPPPPAAFRRLITMDPDCWQPVLKHGSGMLVVIVASAGMISKTKETFNAGKLTSTQQDRLDPSHSLPVALWKFVV